jgi:hypothetical protein
MDWLFRVYKLDDLRTGVSGLIRRDRHSGTPTESDSPLLKRLFSLRLAGWRELLVSWWRALAVAGDSGIRLGTDQVAPATPVNLPHSRRSSNRRVPDNGVAREGPTEKITEYKLTSSASEGIASPSYPLRS